MMPFQSTSNFGGRRPYHLQDHKIDWDPRLLHALIKVLSTSQGRAAMQELRGDNAQVLIDFLYILGLFQSSLPYPGLRKHIIRALYKLCKSSMLYPQCLVLKDIDVSGDLETGGGFGDIYRGWFRGKSLCLKAVRTTKSSETDAMLKIFAKEAILWGQLHHPNIAPFYGIYHLNEPRNRVCLVSPWMQRGNLVDYLNANPLVTHVAKGLDYLHSENIIHGDLKGANVLVSDAGVACITDFGLSTILTGNAFAYTPDTGPLAFSFRWLAPELLAISNSNQWPTKFSDVWSFGSVCYELPIRPQGGVSPSRDRIDDDMWRIMNHCWARTPEERPTCQQILESLRRLGVVPGGQEGGGSDKALRACQAFRAAMHTNSPKFIESSMVMDILTGRDMDPTHGIKHANR
ncbi:hypothetical protein D9756_008130 [Leucocoprinus leucothites]|uniref:Protein kinase domain-containing protein n=1 Tax=Leucocoprinus leucothites TaxID=201217 RepID=A0A8H5FXD6_9AGAR|nr:hypothetical protein D9756_008130 [Leucoagaricus leucothites]